jgi:hypothetical protein
MYQAVSSDALLDDFLYRGLSGGMVSENVYKLEEVPQQKGGHQMTFSAWVRTILRREVGLHKKGKSS